MNTARLSGVLDRPSTRDNPVRSVRRCAGALIVGAGTLCAVHQAALAVLSAGPQATGAVAAGALAATATAIGTIPVALSRRVSVRYATPLLGFGVGIMLAASVFSLILPALQQARRLNLSGVMAAALVSIGILMGAAILMLLGQAVARSTTTNGRGSRKDSATRRAWLFVLAITLHNVPEGSAIGVAFAGLDHAAAVGLATGIGVQDIPEGLVVALALRAAGYGRGLSVAVGIASGMVEPIFAGLAVVLVTSFAVLLPWALAGAAGAMLFVIANEVIPETHRGGRGGIASLALMVGFVVMLFLDTALS